MAGDHVKTPKEVVQRFLDAAWTSEGWNMDVIEECFDERYWSHTWQGDLAHTGARQGRFFAALEQLEELESAVVAEGDLVVHRSRRRVRHVGEIFGVAPTGREVVVDHVEMWRVADGKIAEHWGDLGAGGAALPRPHRPRRLIPSFWARLRPHMAYQRAQNERVGQL